VKGPVHKVELVARAGPFREAQAHGEAPFTRNLRKELANSDLPRGER